MKNTTICAVALALASSPIFAADSDELHAFDPRNTQSRIGTMVNTDSGELKLFAGYGAANLYDAGPEGKTQTVLFGEYFTDTDNMRARMAHFDSRAGGIYVDLYGTKLADSYTAGYMLPLEAANGTTKFFPSVNYTYVDVDLNKAADRIAKNSGGSVDEIQSVLHSVGAKDAHLASVNLYALQPWNDTHYTVIQAMAGQAVDGIDDLNFVDLMWVQGMQAYVNGQNINIFVEGRYHNIETEVLGPKKRSEDAKISLGIDWRF